jgi:hypothetical protein
VGNTGFTIPGSKDEAFAKVGTALEGVQGVTIASRSTPATLAGMAFISSEDG